MNDSASRPLQAAGHTIIALLVALYGAMVLVLSLGRAVPVAVFALIVACAVQGFPSLKNRSPFPRAPSRLGRGCALCPCSSTSSRTSPAASPPIR